MAKLGTRYVTLTTVGVSVLFTLTIASRTWSQPQATPRPPIPEFPVGDDFAGVAGSATERARITALCGPNRNAADGYAPAPAFPGQTKAPIVKGTQGFAVETVATIDRPWGIAFLPNGKMLVSFRNGGMRVIDTSGAVSEPLANVPQMVNPRLLTGMYGVWKRGAIVSNRSTGTSPAIAPSILVTTHGWRATRPRWDGSSAPGWRRMRRA